jgi:hypothetical protein
MADPLGDRYHMLKEAAALRAIGSLDFIGLRLRTLWHDFLPRSQLSTGISPHIRI